MRDSTRHDMAIGAVIGAVVGVLPGVWLYVSALIEDAPHGFFDAYFAALLFALAGSFLGGLLGMSVARALGAVAQRRDRPRAPEDGTGSGEAVQDRVIVEVEADVRSRDGPGGGGSRLMRAAVVAPVVFVATLALIGALGVGFILWDLAGGVRWVFMVVSGGFFGWLIGVVAGSRGWSVAGPLLGGCLGGFAAALTRALWVEGPVVSTLAYIVEVGSMSALGLWLGSRWQTRTYPQESIDTHRGDR